MQLEGLKLEPGIKIEMPAVPVGYIDTFGGGTDIFTNNSQSTRCAMYDNLDNLYVCGRSGSSGTIAKFDSVGTLLWQKTLSKPNPEAINFYSLSLDNSNNVYVTGVYYTDDTIFNTAKVLVVKYDTNGNLQWQKTLGSSGLSQAGFGVTVEKSTGNFYVCGIFQTVPSENTPKILLLKYDSVGTVLWQRSMTNADSGPALVQAVSNSIALDSSGNVYVVGTLYGNSLISGVLIKYNSSGVLQWQVGLYKSTTSGSAYYGIVIDSSNNIFVCGIIDGDLEYGDIVKYNSSGVIQWKRQIGTNIITPNLSGITVDSLGNIYTVGADQNFSYIIKYNNNGIIQWQRSFSGSVSVQLNSIIVDSLDNLLITGYIEDNPKQLIMLKVPSNGAPIGTYSASGISFTYAKSTLLETELTVSTVVDTTLSPGTPSFTTATLSATNSTSTFTNTVTEIPY